MQDIIDAIAKICPPKYQPLVLMLAVLIPFLGRAYHAISSGGGIRGIWNGIIFGTNTPKQDDTGANPASKPSLPLSVLAIGLIGASVIVGCGSPNLVAYKSTSAVETSVDTAMQAYGDAVRHGIVSADTQAKVKAAYQKYFDVLSVERDYVLQNKTPGGDTSVVASISATASDLLALVQDFVKK